MKTLYFAAVFLTFILLIPYHASANSIRVPAFHFPPWIIVQGAEVSGINIQILEKFSEQLSLDIVYVPSPFKRSLQHMETGYTDLATSLLKRPEREVYMYFIEPAYKTKSTKAFYVKKGNANRIKEHKDLYNLKIGVERGTKYFDLFDNDRNITKVAITSGPDQLHLLLLGNRIDTFIETASSMDYRLNVEPGLNEKIEKALYSYNYEIPVFMAVSKKSSYANQIPQFNKVMKEMVEQGIVEKIIKDFLSPYKP
jgi:polar amino acid transport system substrate-binding protein